MNQWRLSLDKIWSSITLCIATAPEQAFLFPGDTVQSHCANALRSCLGALLVGSSTSTSVTSTVGGGWSTTTSPPLLWMSALPSVPSFSSSVFSFLARLCLIIGAPLSLAPLLTELVLLSERQSAETITTVLAHGSGKLLATNEGSNLAAYQNWLCRGAIVGNNCEGERLSYVRIIQHNLWLVFLEVSIPLIVSIE